MNKPTITEKEFTGQIKELAATFGYSFYHTWHSIHSAPGFPDCVLAKPGRLIFCELKSETGKVSNKQQEWLDVLEAAGAETYLFRPSQFEEMVQVLRGKTLLDTQTAILAPPVATGGVCREEASDV